MPCAGGGVCFDFLRNRDETLLSGGESGVLLRVMFGDGLQWTGESEGVTDFERQNLQMAV